MHGHNEWMCGRQPLANFLCDLLRSTVPRRSQLGYTKAHTLLPPAETLAHGDGKSRVPQSEHGLSEEGLAGFFLYHNMAKNMRINFYI